MFLEFNTLQDFYSKLDKLEIHDHIKIMLKHIVRKKLIGKNAIPKWKICELFSSYPMYKAFIHLPLKRLHEICVSEHYLLLRFKYPRKYLDDSIHTYVIGADSETEKLFIHKTVRDTPYNFGEIYLYVNDKSLYILLTRDEYIWEVLGYTIDYDLNPHAFYNINLDKRGMYFVRIQGDLVLEIMNDKDLASYYATLTNRISERINNLVLREITRRIAEILESYGITLRRMPFGITIEGIRKNTPRKKVNKILEAITKIIYHELDITDILEWLNNAIIDKNIGFSEYMFDIKDYFIAYKCEKGGFKIMIDKGYNSGFGVELYDIVNIRFDDVNNELFKEKVKEIVNELKEQIDFTETTLRRGRHVIKAKALPVNMRFPIKFLDREEWIQLTDLPIVVKGKVVIEHPEHRTKKLFFPVPVRIIIDQVQVDERFLARLNKYTLDQLTTLTAILK